MSNHLAIATVTAALQNLLKQHLLHDVSGESVEVTAERPGATADPPPGANVYLYRVAPNAHRQNADLPTRRADGTLATRPAVALDLHYLITTHGDETHYVPQRCLGSVVRTLHAHPTLTREEIRTLVNGASAPGASNAYLAASDLAEQLDVVRFSPISLNLEELSKIWSVFFQTPHDLAVSYVASVVVIEGDVPPRPPLPVRGRRGYSETLNGIVVDDVVAAAAENAPIHAGDVIHARGSGFLSDVVKVRIADLEREIDLDAVHADHVEVPLAEAPFDGLSAGVHGLQVAHERMMGDPATPHRGAESNVAPFVLRPRIQEVDGNYAIVPTLTPDEPLSLGTYSGKIAVTLTPNVGKHQRVVLLLNEFNVSAPEAYAFRAPEREENGAVVEVPVKHVKPGTYLVRVQVDGAENPLVVDETEGSPTENQYVAPTVEIPV